MGHPDLIVGGCDHQSVWHQNGGFGLLDVNDRHDGNGDLANNKTVSWEAAKQEGFRLERLRRDLSVFAEHFGVEADPVVGDEHPSLVEDVLL